MNKNAILKVEEEIDRKIQHHTKLQKMYKRGDWNIWSREQGQVVRVLKALKKYLTKIK